MDEKFSSGPAPFPDWDNTPSADKKDETIGVFSPSDGVAPPSTAIPVTADESEPAPVLEKPFKPFDSMVGSPSPALAPKDIDLPGLPEPPAPEVRGDAEHPLAVTQVYSSYGLEYLIMLISLGVLAFSLGSLLSSVVDLAATKSGSLLSSIVDPYSEAALIVSLPIFIYLFLRLEAREESHASFLADSSRRRGIQIILVISFLFFIGELISYIGALLNGASDSAGSSLNLITYNPASGASPWWADFLHALIGLVIAGGVFAYFWYKLHKKTGAGLE